MSATFKTGDRVRCTLGDSVLVGVVMHNSVVIYLEVDGSSSWSVPLYRPWTVEVIQKPEHDWQPGDVALDATGEVYRRTPKGHWWHGKDLCTHEIPVRPLTLLVPAKDDAA